MSGVPCLTIHHHDKLKVSYGSTISYYGFHKNEAHEKLNQLLLSKDDSILPIDRNITEGLINSVINLI
jgi:hypothetical protein